jgi:hypothetical protein
MGLGGRIYGLFRGNRSRELEVHIPISPTRHFFTMLHYFAASLRLNGGAVAGSRIVVTVGEDCEPYDLDAQAPWARRYHLEWRWLERGLFRRHSYYATANERFRYAYLAPAVMLADADTFVAGELGGLVNRCLREQAFAGVIAHVPPFEADDSLSPGVHWQRLYQALGLAVPAFVHEHTGFGVMRTNPESRYCPPYFNLGMLVAPAPLMNQIGELLYADMEAVDQVYPTPFKCQIALTLSLAQLDAKAVALPMRYNFANDDRLAGRYPGELTHVRLFHYLRRHIGPFDKTRDFGDYPAVDAFLARTDLDGVNRVMQEALRRVQARVKADLAAAAS